ncbi:MAG: amino transferase [Parcubacteria group bacterium Licking1014_1]|nr:MAG: amino transferase [Parcubacteria group bacterium Licking1014_1]
MRNILLIQFRKNKLIANQEKKCLLKILKKKGVNLTSENLFLEKAEILSKYLTRVDGIIIGGSGEFSFSKKNNYLDLFKKIKESAPFIKKAIKKDIPILGICLGHQYLSYIFGSKVTSEEKQKEFGTFNVHLTPVGKKDPIFYSIVDNFLAQQGHEDCVKSLPKNAILLAKSDNCKIEGFKIKNKNVYGVQFHPELEKKDSKARLKMAGIKEGIEFKESPLAKKVIINFLKLKQKKTLHHEESCAMRHRRSDSNAQPLVLETNALPIELRRLP